MRLFQTIILDNQVAAEVLDQFVLQGLPAVLHVADVEVCREFMPNFAPKMFSTRLKVSSSL